MIKVIGKKKQDKKESTPERTLTLLRLSFLRQTGFCAKN